MKKQTIKLNEAQLRRLIKESVKKTLNEMYGGLWNSDGEWTGGPAVKTAEVEISGEDIVSAIVDDFTGFWPTKEYFEDPEKLEKLYSRGWGPDIEFLQQQGIDPSDTQTVINFVKKLAEDEFNGTTYTVEKDELFGVTRGDNLRVDLRDFFNKYADKFNYFDNGSDDLYDNIIDNIEYQEPYDSRPDKIEDDD